MNVEKIPFDRAAIGIIGPHVIEALQRDGAAIVTDLPDGPGNAALLTLAGAIGNPQLAGSTEESIVEPIRAISDPLIDGYGRQVISQTNARFDMHTDEYFLPQPAHIVLLHCVVPDPDGNGISLLCHVDEVAKRLTQSELDLLRKPIYPHPCGRVPILESKHGSLLVRYNLMHIREGMSRRRAPSDDVLDVISAVEAAISLSQTSLMLCAGHCLIVDNRRVLHARTEFRAGSPRLLKRLRLNNSSWPPLSGVVEEESEGDGNEPG